MGLAVTHSPRRLTTDALAAASSEGIRVLLVRELYAVRGKYWRR